MNNFNEAIEKLNGRTKRKLENNTYLETRDADTIAVRLHSTDVVTYKRNGDVILNSGGWRTLTTKSRINEYSPIGITQKKSVWYLSPSNDLYHDGVTIKSDGSTDAKKETKSDVKKIRAIKKSAKKYSDDFIEALNSGKVPKPSAGDCFYCGMRDVKDGRPLGELTSSDHLMSHMQEGYYVPSLLVNAFDRYGASIAMKDYVARAWEKEENPNQWGPFVEKDVKRRIYKYVVSNILTHA